MFIQTEQTPNPATLKFIPGQPVMPAVRGTLEFRGSESAGASPLAKRLFDVPGVTGVFLASDFVSVTKGEDADWSLLKTHVLAEIMQHFTSGMPVINDEIQPAEVASTEQDSDVVIQIKDILDTRIRPAVAADGGDVVFDSFRDGVVYLRMQGACAGCPSSSYTLKSGIENMLRHYIPEVIAVEPAADYY